MFLYNFYVKLLTMCNVHFLGKTGKHGKIVKAKMVDDKLKIIDDVPTSAVEMAVKEKVWSWKRNKKKRLIHLSTYFFIFFLFFSFSRKSKDKRGSWKKSKLCSNLIITANVLQRKTTKIFFENVFLRYANVISEFHAYLDSYFNLVILSSFRSVIAKKVILIRRKSKSWSRDTLGNTRPHVKKGQDLSQCKTFFFFSIVMFLLRNIQKW